jgi:ubiquinone biosynthesis protein COQ4
VVTAEPTSPPRTGRRETVTLFVRSMLAALRDSNETEALLTGEEISSVGRMRALVPVLEASEEGRAILRERPRGRDIDLARLRSMPQGSLGRAYVAHLDRCGLDPRALDVPVTRGERELDNYLLERVRQTHDLWHTVLGLGTAGHEEVLVHAFQWPQLHMPYSALVVGFGTPKHFVLEGRFRMLRTAIADAVRAGRAAAPLLAFYWERHLEEPLEGVRAALRVRPSHAWRA